MHTLNRTKVVATVGPACQDEAMLAAMINEGVDVFRVNFSHGAHAEHAAMIAKIRAAAAKTDAVVAIMGDLCGPKIRLTEMAGGEFAISVGASIRVERGTAPCTSERLSVSFARFCDEVQVGHRVLIDDGQIRLRVVSSEGDALVCRCETAGIIRSRKGVNLPDTRLSLPSLTDKDHADLAFAITQDLDYVALSFVREAEDLSTLRREIKSRGAALSVLSKIERPEALEHLDEIIELSDAVMVARGDLGVEMDVSRVPLIQKDIVRRCGSASKPVIVATQMLQSMVEAPVPTRAEVCDVANAILDGADAVMLSAETSVGKFPLEALRVIRGIASQTEAYLAAQPEHAIARHLPGRLRFASAVAHGAAVLARELDVHLLIVASESGATIRLLSSHRPPQMIVGVSPDERVCRGMALYYGVQPLFLHRCEGQTEMLAAVDKVLLRRSLAKVSDLVLMARGTRLVDPGATNALLIHLVGTGESA